MPRPRPNIRTGRLCQVHVTGDLGRCSPRWSLTHSGQEPQAHTPGVGCRDAHKRAPEKALAVIPSLPGLACALARGCWPQPGPPPVSGPPAAAMLAYRERALLGFLGCWAPVSTQAAPSCL